MPFVFRIFSNTPSFTSNKSIASKNIALLLLKVAGLFGIIIVVNTAPQAKLFIHNAIFAITKPVVLPSQTITVKIIEGTYNANEYLKNHKTVANLSNEVENLQVQLAHANKLLADAQAIYLLEKASYANIYSYVPAKVAFYQTNGTFSINANILKGIVGKVPVGSTVVESDRLVGKVIGQTLNNINIQLATDAGFFIPAKTVKVNEEGQDYFIVKGSGTFDIMEFYIPEAKNILLEDGAEIFVASIDKLAIPEVYIGKVATINNTKVIKTASSLGFLSFINIAIEKDKKDTDASKSHIKHTKPLFKGEPIPNVTIFLKPDAQESKKIA